MIKQKTDYENDMIAIGKEAYKYKDTLEIAIMAYLREIHFKKIHPLTSEVDINLIITMAHELLSIINYCKILDGVTYDEEGKRQKQY